MKLRLAAVAIVLSVLAVGSVYAAGADGSCAYGSKFRYTFVEPLEQSEAASKLASLSVPATVQETAAQASAGAPDKADASSSPAAEKTTAQ